MSHRIVRLPRWIAICSASVIALQASVAQPATERSIPEEPRVFVQRFLATYVRWLNRDIGRLERMRGLRSGSPFVDLRLLEELEADFAAQASDRSGSIVGIDWEPFVGGQDPCERYEVGSIRVKESARLVDVHPACNARRSDEASATLELHQVNHTWRIVDVWYSADGSLSEHLRRLQAERRSAARPPSRNYMNGHRQPCIYHSGAKAPRPSGAIARSTFGPRDRTSAGASRFVRVPSPDSCLAIRPHRARRGQPANATRRRVR